MKIILCIKQVPDTSDIKWTKDNTINREGVESIINPLDMYAAETALKIKDLFKDTEIIVVSMGPNQAVESIKKVLALGCDKGYLLSDRKFAGADTFATAKTLSAFIKKEIPDFDLVLCGQFAADGDTAQTGPSLAAQLGISQLTYVKNIEFENDKLFAIRETEKYIEKYSVNSPALLCISKGDYEVRRPKIDGFINSNKAEIKIVLCDDIDIAGEDVGLKGSPTFVAKAYTPEISHCGEVYIDKNIEETSDILMSKIKDFKNE